MIIRYPIVTPRDVENLLGSLGLDHGRIRPVAGGWSYRTFEVEPADHGGQAACYEPGWIFRFPGNGVVAENLRKEQAVLPVLAQRVDFAVPRFEYTGTWRGQPYAGYRRIPGRPLSDRPFADLGLADESTRSIAAALSSLHDLSTSLVATACAATPTVDAWRMRYHALGETVRTRVSPMLDTRVHNAVARGFERFLDEELATLKDVALIHCDLGCEHILIGDDGRSLTGLIDFEDATIGDPAIDFVGILVTFGMEAVEKILDRYPRALKVRPVPDVHFKQRLRFYTWAASCHEVLYGLEAGREEYVKDGIEELRIRLRHAGLL